MTKKTILGCIIFLLFANTFAQTVGIGSTQFVPLNTLDVAGSVAIGAGYAGVNTVSPANSLIVQGFTGIGVTAPAYPLQITYAPALNTGSTRAINVTFNPNTNTSTIGMFMGFGPRPSVVGTSNYAYESRLNALFPPDITTVYAGYHSTWNGVGNYGTMAGFYSSSACCPVNSVSSMYGVLNDLRTVGVGNQSITTAYGTYSTTGENGTPGTVGTYYGNYVTAEAGSAITTAYGLYVGDLASAATTSYGVYCVGNQKNYFGGNVGISTVSPNTKLEIAGGVDNQGTEFLRINHNGADGSGNFYRGDIKFRGRDGIVATIGGGNFSVNKYGLALFAGDPGTGFGTTPPISIIYDAIALTTSVGIFCKDPQYTLDVRGTLGVSGQITTSLAVITTGVVNCSDVRYKKNVLQLTGSLDNVLKLTGVNYLWKTDEFPSKGFNDKMQIGFIAQDIEKIFPEMVFTDKEGYKSVDYSRLTPVLVEAIKEQQKMINDLKSLVKTQGLELKAEIDQLKKENSIIRQSSVISSESKK